MSALAELYSMYERALALVRHYYPHFTETQQHSVARELIATLDPDHITLLLNKVERERAQAAR